MLQPINLGHLKICKGSQQAHQPPVDLGHRKQKQDEIAWIMEREEKTKQAVSAAVCSALCTHKHSTQFTTSSEMSREFCTIKSSSFQFQCTLLAWQINVHYIAKEFAAQLFTTKIVQRKSKKHTPVEKKYQKQKM